VEVRDAHGGERYDGVRLRRPVSASLGGTLRARTLVRRDAVLIPVTGLDRTGPRASTASAVLAEVKLQNNRSARLAHRGCQNTADVQSVNVPALAVVKNHFCQCSADENRTDNQYCTGLHPEMDYKVHRAVCLSHEK